jgi:hypothetical protein
MLDEVIKNKQTECEVDDNIVWSELSSNIAVCIGKVGRRCTPVIGVDRTCTTRDVGRNGAARPRPEPNFDKLIRSLHGIPSTTIRVKGRPIIVGSACSDTASDVAIVKCVAISGEDGPKTAMVRI